MRNRKKALLHPYLPQTKGQPFDKLYSNFKKRVRTKSNDNYLDRGKNPIRLVVNVYHAVMDTQETVIVEYQSFNIMHNRYKDEIGFEAVVYSIIFNARCVLRFYILSGKGYIEEIG
ncbi:MAG: hypothetical protein QM490_06300 [Candidatus Gracilibacteria bacterium]